MPQLHINVKVPEAMKTPNVLFGILLTFALAIGVSACSQTDAKIEGQNDPQTTTPAVNVRVEEVKSAPFADAIQVTGIVKAYEDVMLSPEEGGVVKEWLVSKGARVVKGEVIAVLNDEVLRAGFNAADAQYKLSALNYEKQAKVFEEQAISELQLKSGEYNRDAAKAQADLLKARLERAYLKSPINGILNDRFFDEGEFAPPAVPIAHLVNNSMLKIVAEVPEVHASNIASGTTARLTIDAFPGDTLYGKVTYVASTINPNNRTLPVEIIISNPVNKLKPEMIARVKLIRASRRAALLISESVIQQVDRNKYIIYVENQGKAEERVIKLGARQGNLVEILEGLKAGDRLIIAGFQKLVHGQPVTITG